MKKAAKQKVQYSNIRKLFKNGQSSKVYLKNNTVVLQNMIKKIHKIMSAIEV